MKHALPTLLAAIALAAFANSADSSEPLASAAFAWSESPAAPLSETTRVIAKGRTLDLATLEIRAVTIAPNGPAQPSLSLEGVERLIIVKEGLLRAETANSVDDLGPGSVALFLPGEPHRLENAGGAPAVFFSLLYDAELPTDLARGRDAGGSCLVNWNDVAYNAHDRGGHRQNLDRPTAMLKRLEMHTTTLNGQLTNHPPHTHRAEEMVVVIKGRVEMLLGERLVQAQAGDVVYIEANIVHSLRNLGDEPTEYFAFQWQ